MCAYKLAILIVIACHFIWYLLSMLNANQIIAFIVYTRGNCEKSSIVGMGYVIFSVSDVYVKMYCFKAFNVVILSANFDIRTVPLTKDDSHSLVQKKIHLFGILCIRCW